MSEIAAARIKAYGIIMVLVVMFLLFAPGCASTKAPQVTHVAPISDKQSSRVVVKSEDNVTRIYLQQRSQP